MTIIITLGLKSFLGATFWDMDIICLQKKNVKQYSMFEENENGKGHGGRLVGIAGYLESGSITMRARKKEIETSQCPKKTKPFWLSLSLSGLNTKEIYLEKQRRHKWSLLLSRASALL
ncbi:hypothetical protein [Bacillus sp. UNCCL13]|nr:hypothetical protein [Bacillus sp. UNCCL13]